MPLLSVYRLLFTQQVFSPRNLGLAVLLWIISVTASAMGLLEAWQRALLHDPQFTSALYAHNAGQEDAIIGRAALLPSLEAEYGYSQNDATINSATGQVERQYHSTNNGISLQQPLLDYEAWTKYQQGNLNALLADEELRDQRQQLVVRLFQAYSNVLFSNEQIALVQAQLRTYQEQYQLNQRLLQLGEGTRTDLLETEARLNLTQAQLIEAQDNLDLSLHQLEDMVGMPLRVNQLARLVPRFTPIALTPAHYEFWLSQALAHNARLLSATQSLAVAKYEIERQGAGHYPRVKLVASLRNNQSGTESTYKQRSDTQSIGIQVSVPLYAGGRVSAATRQATARYQQAYEDKDAQRQLIQIELRRQFNLVTHSQAKIRAYELAQQSAQALVEATRKSVQGGERVNLDILNAEQQLYSAGRDLTEARYTWLTAWLQLRYYAGTLDEDTLQQLAAYFLHGR